VDTTRVTVAGVPGGIRTFPKESMDLQLEPGTEPRLKGARGVFAEHLATFECLGDDTLYEDELSRLSSVLLSTISPDLV
jgi:hypothetical protein